METIQAEMLKKLQKQVPAEELQAEKRKMLKWTKQLYTMGNRFCDMDYQEMLKTIDGGYTKVKHLSVTENQLKRLNCED